MRKLAIFLAVTTLCFAASTLYLFSMQKQKVPNTAAIAGREVDVPIRAPLPVSPTPLVSSAVPALAAERQEDVARVNDLDKRFLADAADPERRLALIASAKANLKAEYQRLAAVVGLSSAENERLFSLLAEQQVAGRESYLSCLADPSRNPDGCAVDMSGFDLNTVLAPEKEALLEKYMASLSERRLVSRIRGVLPDDQFLPDEKADRLIAALAEENERRKLELGESITGPDRIVGDVPLVYTAGATRESLITEAREHFARLRGLAARELTPSQLKTWDSIMEQRLGRMEYAIQLFLDRRQQR